MSKAFDADGKEIEVYTADEYNQGIQAQVATEVEKVKGEYLPKIATLETELGQTKQALSERSGEFQQFRKLNEETVAKLSVAERTIYENGLALEEGRIKREAAEKATLNGQVDSAIRAKAGTDQKLFDKIKSMWSIIGVEATTAEQIENKTKMILGAISTTEPDLVASVQGFSGGSFAPPVTQNADDKKSFADTDKGKQGMNELGLNIPEKK